MKEHMRFRRATGMWLALAVTLVGFGQNRIAQIRQISDADVSRVQSSVLLIDAHNDLPYYTVKGADVASPSASPHTDIARMKAGGVGATFFSAWVAKDYVEGNRSADRALQLIDSIRHDIVEKHPNDFIF